MKLKTALVTLLALFATACDSNVYDRIPETTVYLKLNIYTTGKDLVAIPSYLSIPQGTYTYGEVYLGYGGLLLTKGMDGVMRAFDLACPVEARSTTRLTVDTSTGIPQAVCPTCGSTFSIADIDACGSPMEGEAREKLYFLRRYSVSTVQSTGDFYITN